MITIDFETKSYADLPKVGTWAYSEDPTTEVICVAYGVDSKPIQTWWPGKKLEGAQAWSYDPEDFGSAERFEQLEIPDQMPSDLAMALFDGHTIEAHNVAFERAMWLNVVAPRFGWWLPDEHQWRDTMALCCYYALPAALDRVASVLGFKGKDPEGARLITMYSKLHLKTAKTHIPDHEWVDWKQMTATERGKHPGAKEAGGYFNEDFSKFVTYCVGDIEIEQSISDHLGDLPKRELPVFLLDQTINLRGIYLDQSGIDDAISIVEQRAGELKKEFVEITGLNPTQGAKLLVWFEEHGVKLENMQAEYLTELLEDGDLESGPARRALEIRIAINKASTKKLDAMIRQRGTDGRARFQTRYHGAVTGRWTGGGFQPLNLNRGFDNIDPEVLVKDISYRDAGWLDAVYGDAMDAVAKASRHWIAAPPGHKIIAGDFTSIEAIIRACIAGEKWEIEAYRNGVPMYEFMADKINGFPAGTVTKETHPAERQDGKTGELAFGYQGALGAWLKFDKSGRHSDARIIEICKAWRAEHSASVNLWYGLENAAIEAVRTRRLVEYREIGFEIVDEWLTMILPNGKRIWYYNPQIRATRPQWCKPEVQPECAMGVCGHDPVPSLCYMAQKEGQWKLVHTYGGKLTENACQAISREILVPAMMRAEAEGYHVILSVYDEIITEVPEGFGSTEEFEQLMAGPLPDWAHDWPVSVKGWEGARYKK
jgi:DNA polymerase